MTTQFDPAKVRENGEQKDKEQYTAAAARAALRQKIITVLSRPRWRFFIPRRRSPGFSQLQKGIVKTYQDYIVSKETNKNFQFTTKHLPRSQELFRGSVVPLLANTISGVALFEVFNYIISQEHESSSSDPSPTTSVTIAPSPSSPNLSITTNTTAATTAPTTDTTTSSSNPSIATNTNTTTATTTNPTTTSSPDLAITATTATATNTTTTNTTTTSSPISSAIYTSSYFPSTSSSSSSFSPTWSPHFQWPPTGDAPSSSSSSSLLAVRSSTVYAGVVAGAAHGLVSWPLDRFLLPGSWGWDRLRSVWRSARPRGHFVDYTLTVARDSLGFAFFFSTYELGKRNLLAFCGEDPERVPGSFMWPQGDLAVKVGTTGLAGMASAVVYGAASQPLESLRGHFFRLHHVKHAPTAHCEEAHFRESSSNASCSRSNDNHQQSTRVHPESHSTIRPPSVFNLFKGYLRGILRAAPSNAISIIVYELAHSSFGDRRS